ncbi:hypothetical protein ACFFGT_30565 [Mucilaginibacter angelicae]|uniref:Tetratricopeptide repeat protein n=1 Tax=Mucilaginibacter angelicae TaxID=869718 RepID=A0ABV6LGI6_9SPHI
MKRWKKLTICSVSFLICLFAEIAINLACGPETDPYDYYASFFHNTIQDNNGFKSFYFNGMAFLNDDNAPVKETDINAGEWAAHLGKTVSVKDVNKAMYDLGEQTDSLLLLRSLKPNGALPDSLKKNTFLKALVSGKNNEALKYYRLIKTIEPVITVTYSRRWDPAPRGVKKLRAFSAEALKLANITGDRFIKLRYFYQAQRLLFYCGNQREAANIYDKYIAGSKSKSHVMGWALSLRAGSELNIGSRVKAAYLFSKVFANYPERRIQAFYEFNGINEPQASILFFAKTANEKAFVYAIRGFHKPRADINALEQVYKIQPRSPLIKLLLVREINKIEEGYLWAGFNKKMKPNPYDYYRYLYIAPDSILKRQKAYIPLLKAFCGRLANEGKYAEPELGNLALAYLSWIQGNNEEGLDALATLNDKKLKHSVADQKQMIGLLLLAQKIGRQDTIHEQELVPALTWLDHKVKWEASHTKYPEGSYYGNNSYYLKHYSMSARDFYTLVLAPAYLKQKDTAMAALAILKGQRTIPPIREYSSPAPGFNMPDFLQRKLHSYDLLKLINHYKAPEKTPFLKILTSEINRGVSYDLYDLLGTAYLREHKYAGAVKAFNKIPASISTHTPYADWEKNEYHFDPFTDNGTPKHKDAKTIKYTKPMFARKMAKLQKLIKTAPKKADSYYYQMAKGLYNTSFYGRSWYLTVYTSASYDSDRKPDEYYDADFLKNIYAEKCFLKARGLSKDNEFKARCTLMAAECQKHRIKFPPYEYDNSAKYNAALAKYNLRIRNNSYFAELKKNYSKTAYYKLTIMDCSLYQDFLALQPKK